MATEATDFWLEFLTFGQHSNDQTEDEMKQNWNYYLLTNFRTFISTIIAGEELQQITKRIPYPRTRADEEATESRINRFLSYYERKSNILISRLPDKTWAGFPTVFSDYRFPNSVSFADRLMINVGFERSIFAHNTVFDGTVFLGATSFDGMSFDDNGISGRSITFSDALFYGEASFKMVQFPSIANFGCVSFKCNITFEKAVFGRSVSFDKASFGSTELAEQGQLEPGVSFCGSTFEGCASFRKTMFLRETTFNYASFGNQTVFDDADFRAPVAFYRTDFGSESPAIGGTSQPALSFRGSRFRGPSSFHGSRFPDFGTFENASFVGRTVFSEADFLGAVIFDDVDFQAEALPTRDDPNLFLSFFGSKFRSLSSFRNCKFPCTSTFETASFGYQTIFDGAQFRGSVKFGQITFDDGSAQAEQGPQPEVSFSDSVFRGPAYFEDIVFPNTSKFDQVKFFAGTIFDTSKFLGPASFERTEFNAIELEKERLARPKVSFVETQFLGGVSFKCALFAHFPNFERAQFHGDASFQGSCFQIESIAEDPMRSSTSFRMARFHMLADFGIVSFGSDVDFDNSELEGEANFYRTKFGRTVRFHNCRFRSTTSFREAEFSRPPAFFEAELHEDLDFSGVDWTKAESSYRRSNSGGVSVHAGDAVRCWDRLALIMSKREKFPERHEFFRLKMRALRKVDGLGLMSFLNWLFEITSDYGWGVRHAFLLWAGQFIFLGVTMAVARVVLICPCQATGFLNVLQTFKDGLALSFANSHAFLRLTSEDGWLSKSRQTIIESCSEAAEFFNYIGFAQAVLGPVLLFLVLLTLRNRFRLR